MIQFSEPNQNWWQLILGASYVVFGIGILIRLLLAPSRLTIAATGAGIQAHEG